MLYLYFVRHGQTEWNAENRIQGRQDSNLTEQGMEHANQLGESLKEVEWTAIYSSQSTRALKTAEIVKRERPLLIRQDERLMEMHLGDWEGMTMEEIKEMNPEQHGNYWNNPSRYQNETGESFEEVKERVEVFLNKILQTYESGNILILTHGVVIKMVQLIGSRLGMDQLWATPYIEGTSVTKLKIENKKIEIQVEGDLSHLH
ncbi:histidine phosphatase family protein [Neobacillus sp. PS3-40]|uniref:histidine phosphatase family protein n=1 Tax=Neobacillus sp. PS3-40 TaxID=3070679 RepID=UPI0027E02F38|nr:histidine phosphatase family protein [Neobacillus sp. PS3-40]WML43026.1 histidine phosphatase family protein [Neobacillus sp. PS3-40]